MFDLIAGLPLHPLVVHAVVVLLPLAAAGTLALAVVPAWRRFGVPVALLATASTALVPVATRSGEALAGRVGQPAGDHATLGGQLLWFALPLAVLVWLLVLADARARAPARASLSRGPGAAARGLRAPDAPGFRADAAPARPGRALVTVLAVLAALAALAALLQVYRVGESGARSVWGDVAAAQVR
ncbi:DUF2231 domain-containing protein [Georgenia daeguensis]|uniref:DUF2231 domain-containing protein n=1 Tax=Georgenia daeguensis TaxID=908355 RepID=UPI0031EDE18A